MRHTGRWALAVVSVIVLAAVGSAVYLETGSSGNGSSSGSPGIAQDAIHTIPGDGVRLSAEVIKPNSHGRAPLLVMPAPWGNAATAYRVIARNMARSGYIVVAYAQRGFGASTGTADFAGPGTQHDAIDVINWALRNTRADPKRIGMFGMSLGAGVSLLTAAHDPRVKAVASLSTWTDLAGSFDQNGTPNTAALRSLLGVPNPTQRFDTVIRHIQTALDSQPGTLSAALRAISPVRSPASYVQDLNRNRPAIFIANAFEDSYFTPAQLVPFFSALHAPKRLELAAGDHGGPERSALSGAPNTTVQDAQAWLDHYVRGYNNGADSAAPIVLRDARTGELTTYQTWPQPRIADRALLPEPATSTRTSVLTTTWSSTIVEGRDSGATSGPIQLVPSSAYIHPRIAMPLIRYSNAVVWNGRPLRNGLSIAGTPVLHVQLSSSSPVATFFVYMYDVSPANVGTLVDVTPYTLTGLQPGQPRVVTLAMRPIAWSLPVGDHLTLLVDTVDQRYLESAPPGATLTLSSTKARPGAFAAARESGTS